MDILDQDINLFLRETLVGETVDALHFWWPALMLSTDRSTYDDITIRIEGTYILTDANGERIVRRDDFGRLEHLCALAREKIASACIVGDNDLSLQFESGITLYLFGDNGSFEGWHVEAKSDEQFRLLVAGIGKELTFFNE